MDCVRKGPATDVAHNEATDNMLEAMFGLRDAKTSKIYTRNAERARLAIQTVAKINWDGIGTQLFSECSNKRSKTPTTIPDEYESEHRLKCASKSVSKVVIAHARERTYRKRLAEHV